MRKTLRGTFVSAETYGRGAVSTLSVHLEGPNEDSMRKSERERGRERERERGGEREKERERDTYMFPQINALSPNRVKKSQRIHLLW